jgi:hypothetical protein
LKRYTQLKPEDLVSRLSELHRKKS